MAIFGADIWAWRRAGAYCSGQGCRSVLKIGGIFWHFWLISIFGGIFDIFDLFRFSGDLQKNSKAWLAEANNGFARGWSSSIFFSISASPLHNGTLMFSSFGLLEPVPHVCGTCLPYVSRAHLSLSYNPLLRNAESFCLCQIHHSE